MIFQETVITFDTLVIALILTSFAGFATTIGAAFAFITKKPSIRLLALGLGFSGGVMLAVSFVELLPSAIDEFSNEGLIESDAFLWANIWFFVGIFTIFAIDFLIPHFYKEEDSSHTHSYDLPFENDKLSISKGEIHKIGILSALGIAVHNFPEGLVTFTSTLQSVELGIVLTIAVGLHNIPEGLSVSIPIVTATGDKWYAFRLGLLSGLAEPVGAFVAAILLFPFLSPAVVGASLAFVAGIMVFISFDELLPAAKNADESHLISLGIIAGMIIMVLTLWLFT
ncbi:MAG: zinc transporter ZupT [Candidatus Heimdallarchaeota archaeon]|nr:MAG: zinc transporter ZupT [Candidatus Heimdallarchaeota archaeon]